jgi:iron(III) transport system ATP-binding protein
MSAPSLSVEDLAVGFGPVTAVDHVGFTVAAGEHVTLLGQSGCGKTTTLRAIAGLERPDGGRIRMGEVTVYDGKAKIDLPPERRGLSMVFQSYAIWPHMTVHENIAFPMRVRGMARAKVGAAVERALKLVDLEGLAARSATKLSGGQQQRVALARAIAFDAKLVLFDEPLSNLDAQLRVQMRVELADLRKRLGFTALYVTHDQEEAFSLSDRIIVMRKGRIEQQGAPAELHASPRTSFVASFLGYRNVLPAEIEASASKGFARARLADGTVLLARDPWGGGPQKGYVAFRPVNLRLDAGTVPEGQGGSGVVTRALFLGDIVQLFLSSGPFEICAHRARPDLVEGSLVSWSVSPADCLVLRE